MNDTVWFSNLPADTNLYFYFHDPEKNLPYQQKADLFDAINNDEATDLSLPPLKMYLDQKRKFRRKALPRVFNVSCIFFADKVTWIFQQLNTEISRSTSMGVTGRQSCQKRRTMAWPSQTISTQLI